jgi:hypothetical protein
MIEVLLAAHISLLSLSLLISIGSATRAVLGYEVPSFVIKFNTVGTGVGLTAGTALLLTKPLSSSCLALLAYLGLFTMVQIFVVKRNQALVESTGI